MYIEALKNSGFKEEMKVPNNNINNNNLYKNKEITDCYKKVNCNKKRKGKIIWFNPHFL